MSLDLAGIRRVALYYAPPPGSALASLGAAWLGTDPETGGAAPPMAEPAGLPQPRAALVARPARYGLHATLKAPFRLADAIDAQTLDRTLTAFAASLAVAEGPGLAVETGLGFVALRPSGPAPAIDALAAACVTQLDGLRAPLTPAEMARRQRADLDLTEDGYLRRWGYPYVLDRFRFHITLTRPLPAAEAVAAAAALAPVFAPALEPRLRIDHLALFGDPGEGRPFRILRRYPLTGRG